MSTSVPASALRNCTTPADTVSSPRFGARTSDTFAAYLDRAEARLDLAVITGLDTDLVLGSEDAGLESDLIRQDALSDMLDCGFISLADVAAGYGRAAVLADILGLDPYALGVVEDIEREDDDLGPEPEGRSGILPVSDADIYGEADDYFAQGWAA